MTPKTNGSVPSADNRQIGTQFPDVMVGRLGAQKRDEQMTGFEKSIELAPKLACLTEPSESSEFQFERDDWTLFRSLSTLSQKAGQPTNLLRRLVLKELVDNALDACGEAQIGETEDGGYTIQDNGPGIDPGQIARLFSIKRSLVSSKVWRLPTRGTLGNGLRVVAGTVLASDGSLKVWTRNQCFTLKPQMNGTTLVESEPADFSTGTKIEIYFGDALPKDKNNSPLRWAEKAAQIAVAGEPYRGKSSPWWYDVDSFFELLQAAGRRSVRELIATLDGCSGDKAGKITSSFRTRACNSMSKEDARKLLVAARAYSKPVKPTRLGSVGKTDFLEPYYAKEPGVFYIDGRQVLEGAEIPFLVETYADADDIDETVGEVLINRTPITGEIYFFHEKRDIQIYGCGLTEDLDVGKRPAYLTIHITTPYCPITTDGKEPNLEVFSAQICSAVRKAYRRAIKAIPAEGRAAGESQKSIILDNLEAGIAKASGEGRYRFNQRQLFYMLRPYIIDALGVEPTYKNFQTVITDYEAEYGDIPGMYRDIRGSLYHPHTGETIPIGTRSVEDYEYPQWTFNKVLYSEKEGLFEILKEDQWPERHDCALLTSKGYATRATRDLLDLIGETDEPMTMFCIHDADAAGTMIYQTLVEETRARPKRQVEVINLGLEPWEALDMDFAVEKVPETKDGKKKKRKAVANYVDRAPGRPPHGNYMSWAAWLQKNRVELNVMNSPQFLSWLDDKMAPHETGKVVPPDEIAVDQLRQEVEERIRRKISEKYQEQIDREVKQDVGKLSDTINSAKADIHEKIIQHLEAEPTELWLSPVKKIADNITSS